TASTRYRPEPEVLSTVNAPPDRTAESARSIESFGAPTLEPATFGSMTAWSTPFWIRAEYTAVGPATVVGPPNAVPEGTCTPAWTNCWSTRSTRLASVVRAMMNATATSTN